MNSIRSLLGVPSHIYRGTLIVFSNKVVGAFCTLSVNIIIANHHGTEALGTYNLVLTTIIILGIFGRFGLDTYSVHIIPSLLREKANVNDFIRKVLILASSVSLILSVFWRLISPYFQGWFFETKSLPILEISLIIIPFVLYTLSSEIFKAFKEIHAYSFLRNAIQPLLVFTILVISLTGFKTSTDPINALFLAIGAISIIATITLWSTLKRKGYNLSSFTEKLKWRPIISKSYPMLLASSGMFFLSYLDHYAIGYFHSEREVGLYSACLQLSMVLAFLLRSINSYMSPQFAEAFHLNDSKRLKNAYWNVVKLSLSAAIPFMIILFLFHSTFLGLFGTNFIQARSSLFLLSAANLISAACGPVGTFMNMIGQHHMFMRIVLISLLINFILNMVLVPRWSVDGAAIATLVSSALWNLFGFSFLRFKLKQI